MYRNNCAEYGLEDPKLKLVTPPKVVKNDRAKIIWHFQIQTDKQLIVNQTDIVVIDKLQEKAVVLDVAIPGNNKIKKKEHKKLKNYQGLKENMEKMLKVKATVVLVLIGAFRAVIPVLGEWLQKIPGTT